MPGFVSANLERMKNALAAQKSAGQTRSRGYGAVREAISGAGGRILDVLGRKNLMRHEIDKQTQAEKATSVLEGEKAGYRSDLQAEGAEQDIARIERQAELDAEAEGKNIAYLKRNGLWQAYLDGKRAGNPDAERIGNPGINWLLEMWSNYKYDLEDQLMVETIDPVTQEKVMTFQRDKVRWDDVRKYMVNAMSRDSEMKKEFLGPDGQYSEEEFLIFVDSWIDTQKRAAMAGPAEGRAPYGPQLAELGGEPLQGEELYRYGTEGEEIPVGEAPPYDEYREKGAAIDAAKARVAALAGTGLIEALDQADQTTVKNVTAGNIQEALALIKGLEDFQQSAAPSQGSPVLRNIQAGMQTLKDGWLMNSAAQTQFDALVKQIEAGEIDDEQAKKAYNRILKFWNYASKPGMSEL